MNGLAAFWTAVWPNLAADVIWIPVIAGLHWLLHRRLTRHVTRTIREHLGLPPEGDSDQH